jgi:hypothetical protein
MAQTGYALGHLRPVLYFENSSGNIMLPPTDEDAYRIKSELGRRGYELREAGTLAEIDRLQKRLQDDGYKERQAELERDEITMGQLRRQVRERLLSRMVSSSTTPYERDFISAYLMLRDDKRAEFQKRFMLDEVAYFTQREYDNPKNRIHDIVNRTPDSKDTVCRRCGEYRKVPGKDLCARCDGLI